MSADLISRDPYVKRLVEEGFEIEITNSILRVYNIPYVRSNGTLARGILTCPLAIDTSGITATPVPDHTMYFAGDAPCHRTGAAMTNIINSSQEQTIGDLKVCHYLSSKPEITQRYENIYDKVINYETHIGGAARSIDRSANARTHGKIVRGPEDSPFTIPDSASARYGTLCVSRKLRRRLAIIGLGGTGAYVLDLVSKSWATEIHLYDDDQLLTHNLFRLPGSPEFGLLKDFPLKVNYYAEVYGRLHTGIRPHPVRVTQDNIEELAGFDFVFVCVDKGTSRRVIAEGLLKLKIPFVDTGIGLGLEDDVLDGCSRVTFVRPGTPWSEVERFLSFGDDNEEDDLYHTAIQISDINAQNAMMAVMRWKRWAGFYRDERDETNAIYMIEGNNISNRKPL